MHKWEQRIGGIKSVSHRLMKVIVVELGHFEDMITSMAKKKDYARVGLNNNSTLINFSGSKAKTKNAEIIIKGKFSEGFEEGW